MLLPLLTGLLLALVFDLISAITLPDAYNVVWTTQSKNSSESMPLGGGDIGLNVWVENGTHARSLETKAPNENDFAA